MYTYAALPLGQLEEIAKENNATIKYHPKTTVIRKGNKLIIIKTDRKEILRHIMES